ncbi:MAG TPA: LPXTG cell wall anchor domain-containing protein [Micromonosporaceae bacterium]|nr:LPXTG cell wall anchor domain-containing protein [Micromonosporaceae bacterium]
MRLRRGLRPALLSTAAAAACLAILPPATAVAADPRGNNGTVKIGEVRVDGVDHRDHANHPHVPCDFELRFFNFDKDQTASITFTIHPPSGSGEVLLNEHQVVSDDPAGGGQDLDAVFTYSGNDFGLGRFQQHPKQGYHVKLTIKSDGVPGGVKHKTFWLKCLSTTPGEPAPSDAPIPTESSTAPGEAPSTSPASDDGGLPVTGAAAGAIALGGLALVGGGAALLVMRRRRENITFTS